MGLLEVDNKPDVVDSSRFTTAIANAEQTWDVTIHLTFNDEKLETIRFGTESYPRRYYSYEIVAQNGSSMMTEKGTFSMGFVEYCSY